MKKNCGRDVLIPINDWVNEEELFASATDSSLKIPHNKVVVQANEKILELFEPKNKIAIVSRCTSSRPYIKSQKWKVIKNNFGEWCDLIVASSAGVIPEEFWNCYPFCTYDDMSPPDRDWLDYVEESLVRFFKEKKYDLAVFYMTPKSHHREKGLLERVAKRIPCKSIILPTVEAYNEARIENFMPYGRMFPECSYSCIKELTEVINEEKD